MLFIEFENDNLVMCKRLGNKDLEIFFKPNCPQKIKEMWDKLNEPIRRKDAESV